MHTFCISKVAGFCRWFPNNLTGRDEGGLVERTGFVKLHFPPSSNLVWILERTFGESFRRVFFVFVFWFGMVGLEYIFF